MAEPSSEDASGGDRPELADLAEALSFMKADASKVLKDLLRGISMWGITALMAFLMSIVWLALAGTILSFAHPYGSSPQILETLYVSYAFAVGSVAIGMFLFWRYYSLRRRYVRLFEIATKLG
jgi:hypothetical protein